MKNYFSHFFNKLLAASLSLPFFIHSDISSMNEWDENDQDLIVEAPIPKKSVTAKLSKSSRNNSNQKSKYHLSDFAKEIEIDPKKSRNYRELAQEDEVPLEFTDEQIPSSTPIKPVRQKENVKAKDILINFNNINIIEFIRYFSKIANKNFYFDEAELDFNITIISEEMTTIENVMTALLQELRIHDFEMMEQGDNIIIHKNASVQAPGTIRADSLPETLLKDADIVTQVFRLNTANANSVSSMIQPILSGNAIINVLEETNHIIVTDLQANIKKIAQLIKSIDAPNSSLIIGQYVVRNAFIDTLIKNAEQIMQSLAPGQNITFVAHLPSNSIFIVSTSFLVERTIPILQRLDQTDGTTGIFNLDDIKYSSPDLLQERGRENINEEDMEIGPDGQLRVSPEAQGRTPRGRWQLDKNGNWFYEPENSAIPILNSQGEIQSNRPPEGFWKQGPQGNWEFSPEFSPFEEGNVRAEKQPAGFWEQTPDGKWRFLLSPGESIFANKQVRTMLPSEGLPLGHIERTKFLIHKLNYRLGDMIEAAMIKIADSLRLSESVNHDLVATLQSVQWLEASNSIVITGSPESLLKVKELIDEIDQPLRQVFIEMLILETTVDDSLNYTVNMGNQFRAGNGNVAGAQAFQSSPTTASSTLGSILATAGPTGTSAQGLQSRFPNASSAITNQNGYNFGIVGQKVTMGGIEFDSIAAIVRAVHTKVDTNIIMNPKILTEDNVTAEIFVGENTPYQTQSISNDQGAIITNNFEFRDVGTTLRVTPLLGPSNIITLQIEEEVSNVLGTSTGGGLINSVIGPTTRINRTSTQVHIPDGYFLVISGMIREQKDRTRDHVPCLGGAPLIGAAFTGKTYTDAKRCLMIFIRPRLIDTPDQMDNLTRHQQNIFRVKSRTKKMWKLDVEEALDWMNLMDRDAVNDERKCCDFKY